MAVVKEHGVRLWMDERPLEMMIDETGVLHLSGGGWPYWGGAVLSVQPADLSLEGAVAVYLTHDGRVIVSDVELSYGEDLETFDLLAWRDGDGWNIKRLIVEGRPE